MPPEIPEVLLDMRLWFLFSFLLWLMITYFFIQWIRSVERRLKELEEKNQ